MDTPDPTHFDQVAGHGKLRLFPTNDLIVIKPCAERELEFYQDISKYPEFQDFIPECYGTIRAATENDLKLLDSTNIENDKVKVDTSQIAEQSICLENLLHGFTKPCILDLKMGSLLYDENATEEKRNRVIQHSMTTTSGSLGIRICGMKVYDSMNKRYISYTKQYGKSRTVENMTEALLAFLFPASQYSKEAKEYQSFIDEEYNINHVKGKVPAKYLKWIIECFRDIAMEIREAVVEHANLRLIGSSLLFIYEGDREAVNATWEHMLTEDDSASQKKENEEEEELGPKMCDLRLIDFVHSDWNANRSEQDPELVKGYDKIIEILEECLKRQSQEKL